ncbi:M56 family metallopeptidase [Frankia sp. Mgl5]|uniref:M56 family metallopeptidase n=1 Tax=Frankia sp. Mgl5 TaxID=2933793 RepID=UPI00200EA10F|nr:M56 family metallopeptidase [Frankia sp. Mgl5]MCK9929944.1 M56 family metallopeptidase [Frankia sp. Mgl5]
MIFGVLAVYAALLAYGLPRPLHGASWTSRAPRLAVVMWLAAMISVVSVAVLVATLLFVPLHAIGDTLVLLVQWCGWPGHSLTISMRWTIPRVAGVVVSAAAVLRLLHVAVAVAGAGRRSRVRHRHDVRLLGRFHPALRIYILDHAGRSAFCLPGRSGGVVVTEGALRALPPAELDAVIAHERAHLAGRHHLILTATAVLARAFPAVPLFGTGHEELRRLVELTADDSAARRSAPHVVAEAVLRLAAPPAPVLGMANTAVRQRVLRLLTADPPLPRAAVAARGLIVVLLLFLPLVVTAVPALSDLGYHCS